MVTVGPLKLRNPVLLASGVLGDTPEHLRTAYESGAGAVVTKSITLEPREGNPEPNVFKLGVGWILNRVGLRNPGAAAFADALGNPDYPVIVSLAGSMPSDFAEMVGMFRGVVGFELNISCPNVEGLGDHVGNDPVLTTKVVEATKAATNLPIFVKVGYQMGDSVEAAVDAGVDGITAINTIPGMEINYDHTPPTQLKGGLSGMGLLAVGTRVVSELVARYKVPVMGCGGVSAWEHAAGYLIAGAAAVQVGTAAMYDPTVLGRIAEGLKTHPMSN